MKRLPLSSSPIIKRTISLIKHVSTREASSQKLYADCNRFSSRGQRTASNSNHSSGIQPGVTVSAFSQSSLAVVLTPFTARKQMSLLTFNDSLTYSSHSISIHSAFSSIEVSHRIYSMPYYKLKPFVNQKQNKSFL